MVPNAEAVNKILTDPKRGILTHCKEKSLIVDCSTIGPSKAKENFALCAEKKSLYVDAAASGGLIAGQNAQLTFMVGAENTSVFN